MRSLIWPGAVTISYNDKFASLYIGNGLKSLPVETLSGDRSMPGFYQFEPLPPMQQEYGGDELVEGIDPTVEEEKQFEEMMRKSKEEEAAEGEGEDGANNENGEEEADE